MFRRLPYWRLSTQYESSLERTASDRVPAGGRLDEFCMDLLQPVVYGKARLLPSQEAQFFDSAKSTEVSSRRLECRRLLSPSYP
jgi:hypothetical protein